MAETLREFLSGVILFSDFRVVTQATPDTVPAKTTTLVAFSNANNSYDSTTLGLKLVAKLASPLRANTSGTHAAILMLDYAGGLRSYTNISDVLNGVEVRGTTNATDTDFRNTLDATVRVRPVLADFDPTLATWNVWQSAPPSFGTAIERYAVLNSGILGSSAELTLRTSVTTFSGAVGSFVLPRTADIFGFYVDVQPIVTAHTATVTSAIAKMLISATALNGVPFVCSTGM